MKFEYLEIRPCIETKGEVVSYRDETQFEAELARRNKLRRKRGGAFKSYWTLYGMAKEATAIGDFTSKEAAHEVMNAVLAPMAAARDLIDNNVDIQGRDGAFVTGPEQASALLADFINQCSNEERI